MKTNRSPRRNPSNEPGGSACEQIPETRHGVASRYLGCEHEKSCCSSCLCGFAASGWPYALAAPNEVRHPAAPAGNDGVLVEQPGEPAGAGAADAQDEDAGFRDPSGIVAHALTRQRGIATRLDEGLEATLAHSVAPGRQASGARIACSNEGPGAHAAPLQQAIQRSTALTDAQRDRPARSVDTIGRREIGRGQRCTRHAKRRQDGGAADAESSARMSAKCPPRL